MLRDFNLFFYYSVFNLILFFFKSSNFEIEFYKTKIFTLNVCMSMGGHCMLV